jgi:hypothetical protein
MLAQFYNRPKLYLPGNHFAEEESVVRHLKVISVLLILLLLISLLNGCFARRSTTTAEEVTTKTTAKGSTTKTTTQKNETTKAGQTTATTKGTTAGKGSELTDFFTSYMDAKEVIWDKMSETIDASGDYTATMALLGFAFTDLAIAFIPMYDLVDQTGGTLALLGIKNAYKRTKGDTIEFGYDYIYDKDSGDKKKDDHVVSTGLFDTKQNTLKVETLDKSGNEVTNRTMTEITKNKDGSYSSQVISYQSSNDKVTGYFTNFAGEDIWSAIAEKEAVEDFTYNTIFGKKNVSLDNMTQGFTVTTSVSFVDGKAKVETQ